MSAPLLPVWYGSGTGYSSTGYNTSTIQGKGYSEGKMQSNTIQWCGSRYPGLVPACAHWHATGLGVYSNEQQALNVYLCPFRHMAGTWGCLAGLRPPQWYIMRHCEVHGIVCCCARCIACATGGRRKSPLLLVTVPVTVTATVMVMLDLRNRSSRKASQARV